jgi:DNA-binding NarL/FixJ family response regulator
MEPLRMTERDVLRVLIVDDHPLFRKGVSALIGVQPDMELAGAADGMQAAVEMALSLQPDVVLMDLQLPDGSGIQATRAIVEDSPSIRILIVTMFEDDDSVFAAMRAGARGYLLKDSGGEGVVHAIRAVTSGEAVFGPGVAERIMGFFSVPRSAQRAFPELTEREEEILVLVARGKSNQEIAAQLFVSVKTVRNHVSNILLKLQVADRAQAVIRARDAGIGGGSV